MMAAVLPVFFAKHIASGVGGVAASSYWGYANTISMLLIALFAPFLGSVADVRGIKIRLLGTFTLFGSLASIFLGFSSQGHIVFVLSLYILGRFSFSGGNIFYDSLLPHLVSPSEQDKVSSWGYATGYLGGGLALGLSLFWILWPDTWGFSNTISATKFTFVFVGIWWLVFTLPLLINLQEPKRLSGTLNDLKLFKTAWRQTLQVFSELKSNKEVMKFLLAYFLYNDGIGTVMVMAVIFGAEIHIPQSDLLGAILAVQFVGIPATYFFGWLAGKISTKRAIIIALFGYTMISLVAYWVKTPLQFWALAISVGLVQGGAQALSRSFYSNMIPKQKSAEYFSFYDVFSKFSSILGPLLFALVAYFTGSSRGGILSLVIFFIAGIWVLSSVRTKKALQYGLEKN